MVKRKSVKKEEKATRMWVYETKTQTRNNQNS